MLYKKVFFLFLAISFLSINAQAQSVDEFHLDRVFTLDSDGTIALKSDDAEVTIIGSDRSEVHVVVDYRLEVNGFSFGDSEQFDMEVSQENGNLFIKQMPRELNNVVLGETEEEYTILIEAPNSATIDLKGDDENYKIKNIDGEIRINADDADVNLKSYGGNKLEVALDDGTLTLDSGRGALMLNVDDGEAFIKNGNFKTISLSSGDGKFTIQNHISSDGEYAFDLDDAYLELDFTGGQSSPGPINVDVETDDSKIIIYTELQSGDSYQFDMNDAELEFYAESGGGTFYIHHDDADISADKAFDKLVKEEDESKYQLGNGDAEIRIETDDADIELRK